MISIDTLAHFGMYFILAFTLVLGGITKNLNLSGLRLYVAVILVGTAYGTSIELIQGFYIYQRYFDTLDILSNAFGTIFGVLSVRLTGIKLVQIR